MDGEMLASVVSLALVLGMLAALLWWLRRVSQRGAGPGRHIRVIETVAVGRDQYLHLVRLADRGLLIASGPRGAELICELETLPAQEAAPPESSWLELFRTRLRGRSEERRVGKECRL